MAEQFDFKVDSIRISTEDYKNFPLAEITLKARKNNLEFTFPVFISINHYPNDSD